MGLGDMDLLEDGDSGGGGGGGGGGKASAAVSCSICLEAVTDNGDRSWAKLQCGHQFHLDCIGSAFNAKGAMQCPNCRKVEKGQWLYASGHRSLPEFSMDDWAHDEDLYDLSFSEMSFGVHWCPFSGLTRLPSSFDEGDFGSSAYHDLLGQHAVFAEHTAVSSSSHPCPYIAYVGIHPTSSNSSGSVSDGPNFNNHWSSSAVPNEIPTTYAFPGMDVHYHGWEHHHSSSFPTSSSRIGNTDQPSIPSVSQRAARTNSDIPRPGSFVHPFLVSHSSGRPGSSVASSMIPPYPGSVARARDRVQALQAYFQQPSSNSPPAAAAAAAVRTPVMSGGRRSNSHRVVPQVGPVASSSDQAAGGFYFYPSASSGRSFQEAENPNRYHSWEREHLPAFNLPQQQQQVERDQIWGPYHQAQAGSGSDSGIRSGNFRQRHGSERMPSQNRS
ncbi:E3 ubiquitin-protein ligase RFI2-like [Ipomoea triloba]|uniref:E3 ubiquitin-protein ligase RFI2-like n=1 Tax=Ipomoea triloba TaxID=35885 RepID=UPI00125D8B08|nr:E3 ubiquitin-protein ligase RFI2-like [Ipomoea triloba]